MPALLNSRWTTSVSCSRLTASQNAITCASSETSQRWALTRTPLGAISAAREGRLHGRVHDVAEGDVASRLDKLVCELATHARTRARNDSELAFEVVHDAPSCLRAWRAERDVVHATSQRAQSIGGVCQNILYNMDTYRLIFESMLNIVGNYYINKRNQVPGNDICRVKP